MAADHRATRLVLAAACLVGCVRSKAPGRNLLQRTYSLELLQWNIHGECFVPCRDKYFHCDEAFPRCKHESVKFLTKLMDAVPPDFAGIEELGDKVFLDHGLPKRWGKEFHKCGGEQGYGIFPFDVAVLLYDTTTWKPIEGPPSGGCMERAAGSTEFNYRAFVLQSFERVNDPLDRVIVVVAHFRHDDNGIPDMRTAVSKMQERTGIRRLILLADTNREGHTSSSSILQLIDPAAKEEKISSAPTAVTCCYPSFKHRYDRIAASGFPGAQKEMPTVLPFGHKAPAWAGRNMHDPILAQLTYAQSPPSAKPPPAAAAKHRPILQ